jgi:hypothetical protein
MEPDSNHIMDDKEKVDALLRLLDSHLKHLCQTRDIEFKVNISLWTVIVAAGYFLYGKVRIHGLNWYGYIAVSVVVVCAHTYLWMFPIQKSEDTDGDSIRFYRSEVEKLTEVASSRPHPNPSGRLWIVFEVGMTAVLLAGVAFILSL